MQKLLTYAFLLLSFPIFAQSQITGTVTDTDALPLIGTTVAIKSTTKGTIAHTVCVPAF